MKNALVLTSAQDKAWASGLYQPKEVDGESVTYCNIAVQAILNDLGYHVLDNLTAGSMVLRMREHPDWLLKRMSDAQELVNEGSVVIAGLLAAELTQSHAHVCMLTPGKMDFSGKWDCKTPVAINFGRKGTCFRSKGLSWAFQIKPDLFALKDSL
jgi:hypothetical protein